MELLDDRQKSRLLEVFHAETVRSNMSCGVGCSILVVLFDDTESQEDCVYNLTRLDVHVSPSVFEDLPNARSYPGAWE